MKSSFIVVRPDTTAAVPCAGTNCELVTILFVVKAVPLKQKVGVSHPLPLYATQPQLVEVPLPTFVRPATGLAK